MILPGNYPVAVRGMKPPIVDSKKASRHTTGTMLISENPVRKVRRRSPPRTRLNNPKKVMWGWLFRIFEVLRKLAFSDLRVRPS
jgi:hypothetical protein